jgi:hypothetical protein
MAKIELGMKYRDKISGFTGVATGYVRYITGCNQVLLGPKAKDDGTLPSSEWFDEQRVEDVTEAGGRVVLDNGATPGFDRPAPKR